MATPNPDNRIGFKRTVTLPSFKAIITARATGGAVVTVQGQLFSATNQPLGGIGGLNEPVPFESIEGVARWPLDIPADTHYIKWGIRAFRSAGDGVYTAFGAIHDENGTELASGNFGGQIPSGKKNDILVFDGVFIILPDTTPAGAEL